MPTTYEPGITVVIPVGPYETNSKWLPEALRSAGDQTLKPREILIIEDGFDFQAGHYNEGAYYHTREWRAPWHIGVGAAFNFGVALAKTECVFMLGSDDMLEPECLQACMKHYEAVGRRDAYYWVPVKYMSDGHEQYTPCNAAMVTKGLWHTTGGFPVEASTAPDAALLSIMMVHMPELIIRACAPALYNYRDHQDTDTKQHGAWHASNVIVETRNLLTKEWTPPEWTGNFL